MPIDIILTQDYYKFSERVQVGSGFLSRRNAIPDSS